MGWCICYMFKGKREMGQLKKDLGDSLSHYPVFTTNYYEKATIREFPNGAVVVSPAKIHRSSHSFLTREEDGIEKRFTYDLMILVYGPDDKTTRDVRESLRMGGSLLPPWTEEERRYVSERYYILELGHDASGAPSGPWVSASRIKK
ncbi:MAG: hypothetical protein HY365_02810 [Candidatus Aenigmarchaeota archaeon]|nr:hypothetical protein [Candidatus Aenigmarchaeota archaeon]